MKKGIILLAILINSLLVIGQAKSSSDTLRISGKIKNEIVLSYSDLDSFKTVDMGNVTMLNHRGQVRDSAKNVKGIILKDILQKVAIQVDKPKLLFSYYFKFIADDGYKLVLSWNEIFHTNSCTKFLLITESNGQRISLMEDKFSIIAADNAHVGRRLIKNIERIELIRVD